MRQVRQVPGVVVLGSDFKAQGVIRSLGRQGIPAIVVDGQSCSAWFSRYVTRRFSWEGSMENPEFADFLLQLDREYNLQDWMLGRANITTPWNYLRSLLGRNTHSALNWRDPLPALRELVVLISRLAHKPQYKEA